MGLLTASQARSMHLKAPATPMLDDPAPQPAAELTTPLDLQPNDPRWVLAIRTNELMQGPLLRPEHRENLLRLGRMLGLTPFEANLVLAIVQDQARRGEPLSSAAGNLAMVPQYRPAKARRRWRTALAWAAAFIAVEIALVVITLS